MPICIQRVRKKERYIERDIYNSMSFQKQQKIQ